MTRKEARAILGQTTGASPLTKVSGKEQMWTNGKHKALTDSSAYTRQFGEAVAKMIRALFD
eukprot:7576985-Pyramimonas_sp.AAC.1